MSIRELPEESWARVPGRQTEPSLPEVTSSELLTTLSARALAGKHVVFAGHGLPTLAVSLAQRTVSAGIEIIYESGVTGAQPADLPRSISDSVLVTGAAGVLPMAQLFNFVLQGRRVDVGFLGAAQVDRYGSLNSSLIGKDWAAPASKLPGSGGAIEAMAGAGEIFVVMRRHNPRSLVADLDFCTTPGPRRAAAARGGVMPAGLGVTTVITDLGIMTRRGIDEELVLSAVHPGVEVDEVRAATGWDLQVSENLTTTVPPTGQELALLRDILDPERVYLR